MAHWQQIVAEGWSQWADLRLAEAWFLRAKLLATTPVIGGIEAQKNAVREAWTALGNGFRSLDIAPYGSPQFRGVVRRFFGTYGYGTDLRNSDSYWTNGDTPGTSAGVAWFGRESRRLYRTQRPSGEAYIVFKIRYMLDQMGELVDACAASASDCYSPPPYWMDGWGSSPRTIVGGEVDWDNWGFWDGGSLAWLAASHVGKVLPPAHWSMLPVLECADQCIALGALEVLTQARLFAVLLNFRMAAKHRLLSTDALIRAAALVPADLETAAWADNTQSSKVAAQTIIQAGSAVGGFYGALIGAAGQAVGWAPSAVGVADSDMFGRSEPVFERGSITYGDTRLAVPDPPGYTPVRLIVLPPIITMGGSPCEPPREFFSAASRQAWIDSHPTCPAPPP